jgi:xylan 1,4-beta-xylosidase
MLLAAAAVAAAISAAAGIPSNASITLDPHGPASALPHLWSACLGSGHAALTLREDWRQQVRQARRDLGVEAVRFHGVLDDEMSTSLGPGGARRVVLYQPGSHLLVAETLRPPQAATRS